MPSLRIVWHLKGMHLYLTCLILQTIPSTAAAYIQLPGPMTKVQVTGTENMARIPVLKLQLAEVF